MICSMTGYGAAEVDLPDGRVLRVEAKSENHRHLNPSARLPRGWDVLEVAVVEAVRAVLLRGRVYVNVTCHDGAPEGSAGPDIRVECDIQLARAYAEVLVQTSTELNVVGNLEINTLATLPGVLRRRAAAYMLPEPELVQECVKAALEDVADMRAQEGRRLEVQLRDSLNRISQELDRIEARAPRRLLRERDRLRERVRALCDAVDVDEDRLAREIAYLAEKWDIAEEVTRLRSHIALFGETLAADAGSKAGKRLGFVVQEMNREANTIGSKANDARIATSAVTIKEEMERLREQLENVE